MSLASHFTMQDAINALEKEVEKLKKENQSLRFELIKLKSPNS